MTPQEGARIVATLSAAHPAWKVNEATVALWVEMLADLDYGRCAAAVRRILARSNEWPSIAAVRREVADIAGLLAPPVDEACRQFIAAARGGHTDVDREVQATVEALGGWHAVRHSSNIGVLVGQFRSLYADLARRVDDDAVALDGEVAALPATGRPALAS